MNPNNIIWSEDYLLSWDDFQGIPKDTAETIEKSIKAMSRTGFNFRLYNKVITNKQRKKFKIEKVVVIATFNKKNSWVKRDQIALGQENVLLKHEQGHFDLTQSFVSEAKHRIETFVKNKSYSIKENNNGDLEKIADKQSIKITKPVTDKIYHDWKQLQDKYDDETKHGVVVEKQKEYNQKFVLLRR